MRLDGIRVLDLTRLLPGPFATQLLVDAGAEVIKVEDTGMGDYARFAPPYTEDGIGGMFDSINRGKQSVAINLKDDDGRSAFFDLVETADVVFEQFRPGVADRLGIDYESVCERNEDIVYCSLSGYGQTGPDAGRVGHDLNYVATAGLLDVTREGDGEDPQMPGYQIGDMSGGLFAAYSILGGLLSRSLGNGGEYIDVSMTDTALSFSQSIAHEAFSGDNPRPGETPLTGQFPWYDIYECADGRHVTLAALEPEFWETFCRAVDREDLIDQHGTDDEAAHEAVREELTELFAEKTMAEWEDQLGTTESMFAPVLRLEESLEHPQIQSREIVRDSENAPPRVGSPVSSAPVEEVSPDHGADTEAVLSDLGYDDEELEALRERGAIA